MSYPTDEIDRNLDAFRERKDLDALRALIRDGYLKGDADNDADLMSEIRSSTDLPALEILLEAGARMDEDALRDLLEAEQWELCHAIVEKRACSYESGPAWIAGIARDEAIGSEDPEAIDMALGLLEALEEAEGSAWTSTFLEEIEGHLEDVAKEDEEEFEVVASKDRFFAWAKAADLQDTERRWKRARRGLRR